MADIFSSQSDQSQPANVHFAITPSDTVNISQPPRALYCQAAGTAQIVDRAGTVLPYAMVVGQLIPFRGVRINATNTTGTYYGWY